jgi:acyl carrier protein
MTEKELYDILSEIFLDVFDLDDIQLSPNMTAMDIEEWDSLSNVYLLLAVEKRLRFRFNSFEVSGNRNIGEMVQMILKKLNQ